jgi:hypothetical protein
MAKANDMRSKPMTPLTRKVRAVLVKRAKTHDLITFAALARVVGMTVLRNLQSMLDRIHNDDMACRQVKREPKPVQIVQAVQPRCFVQVVEGN